MKLKNSFYRPQSPNVSEYREITEKLWGDLKLLIEGRTSTPEVKGYAESLISQGMEYGEQPALFWNLANMNNMGKEERIDFVFAPTQAAAYFLANVRLSWPEAVRDIPGFDNWLRLALNGASCGFAGHGYEAAAQIQSAVKRCACMNMPYFLRLYPEISPAFGRKYKELQDVLDRSAAGGVQPDYLNGTDLAEGAREILYIIQQSSQGDFVQRLLFTYGTLMHGRDNHGYMKNSRYIGDAVIRDFGIYELGWYPGIVHESGKTVRGELYCVPPEDFEDIRQLEDDGALYCQEVTDCLWEGCSLKCHTFVYNRGVDGCPAADGERLWGRNLHDKQ